MNSGAAPRIERLRGLRAVLRKRQTEFDGPEVKADINVTPLVDVVLVLLIIFMVVTPLIASGVAVDLPKTTHHSRKPDDGKDIIVSITRDGRVYVGTKELDRAEDLGAAIAAEQRRFPDKSVFVKGDSRVRFGVMRKAMKTLRELDITDVVMGTEELTKAH